MNIVRSLGNTSFCENNDDVNNDNMIIQSQNLGGHPSTVAIKEQTKNPNKTFTFQNVSTDKVASIIKKLNTKKLQNLMAHPR